VWQREAPLSTPIAKRIDMWRRGFRESSYTLYDLDSARPRDYIPDSARLDTFFINGSVARGVLNDKLLFSSLLQHHLPIPKTLALIGRGELYAPGQRADVATLVERHGSVILKPSDGSRGVGVYRLATSEDGLTLNGQVTTLEEVRRLVESFDNYLVSQEVQQAAYARAICAETTNTVRVLTLMDPDTAEPFVACAIHRFGTPKTAPVDGWSLGGLSCGCEPDTGTLGPGVRSLEFTNGELRWYSHHPDTGAPLEGVRIPHWKALCDGLLNAVRAFPFLAYVGWDVVVTDDGFAVIEGNNNTDIGLQMHRGLLNQPQVRRFYEYYKVI